SLRRLSQEELVAFQQEAIANSKLIHRNIVSVLDFGATAGGSPFMVMDYVEGENLSRILKKSGTLEWRQTAHIMIELLDALEYAHDAGVFHRDLKPANLLVQDPNSETPGVRLIDFGIALVGKDSMQRIPEQGKAIMGTPAYMSPDAATGYEYSA